MTAPHDRAGPSSSRPGIFSPRKITVKGARSARVADAMTLRATLEQ
jgi:hypothetical protein